MPEPRQDEPNRHARFDKCIPIWVDLTPNERLLLLSGGICTKDPDGGLHITTYGEAHLREWLAARRPTSDESGESA